MAGTNYKLPGQYDPLTGFVNSATPSTGSGVLRTGYVQPTIQPTAQIKSNINQMLKVVPRPTTADYNTYVDALSKAGYVVNTKKLMQTNDGRKKLNDYRTTGLQAYNADPNGYLASLGGVATASSTDTLPSSTSTDGLGTEVRNETLTPGGETYKPNLGSPSQIEMPEAYSTNLGSYVPGWLGNAVGPLANLNEAAKGPDEVKAFHVDPQKISNEQEINRTISKGNERSRILGNRVSGLPNQTAAMATEIAGEASNRKSVNSRVSQLKTQEQQVNTQNQFRADITNAREDARVQEVRQREKDASTTQRLQAFAQIGDVISSANKDITSARMSDNMLQMANTPGYVFSEDDKGNLVIKAVPRADDTKFSTIGSDNTKSKKTAKAGENLYQDESGKFVTKGEIPKGKESEYKKATAASLGAVKEKSMLSAEQDATKTNVTARGKNSHPASIYNNNKQTSSVLPNSASMNVSSPVAQFNLMRNEKDKGIQLKMAKAIFKDKNLFAQMTKEEQIELTRKIKNNGKI